MHPQLINQRSIDGPPKDEADDNQRAVHDYGDARAKNPLSQLPS